MEVFKKSNLWSPAIPAFALFACLGLVACGGGSSSTTDDGNTTAADNMEDADGGDGAGGTDGGAGEGTDGGVGTDTGSSNEPAGNTIDISTQLQPSSNDSGMAYELLGYRMHSGSILAMDVLATNNSDVIKSMGTCNAEVLNGDDMVAFAFSNFLNGAPLRPGDEMAATVFFREVSDPSQVDKAVADCNFTDLVTTGTDPSITHDFIEFSGPDTLGRILVRVQINNDSGDTIKFSRCDFSARAGNRIVENSRFEFNLGRDIQPGEAYIGEGFLILDFDDFESDSFDAADLHCDYDLAT